MLCVFYPNWKLKKTPSNIEKQIRKGRKCPNTFWRGKCITPLAIISFPLFPFFFLLASCLAIIHKYVFCLCGQKEEKEEYVRVCRSREEKCESSSFWTTGQLSVLKIAYIMDNGKSKQQATVSPDYLLLGQKSGSHRINTEDSHANGQNKELKNPNPISFPILLPIPIPIPFFSFLSRLEAELFIWIDWF